MFINSSCLRILQPSKNKPPLVEDITMTAASQSYHVIPGAAKGQLRYIRQYKITAILQLTSGIALVILGIAAVITRAMWSFFAPPVFCGLLFLVVTGIVGMCAAKQRKHHLTAAYIGLSVMCAVISFGLFVLYCWIIRHEKTLGYVHFTYCNPLDYLGFDCRKTLAGRIAIAVLIVLTSLVAFIASILGVLFGSCFNCSCCTTCFKECYSDAPDCCLCCGQRSTNEAEDTAKLNPEDGSVRLQVVSDTTKPTSGDEPV